jgi:hypothetical protein
VGVQRALLEACGFFFFCIISSLHYFRQFGLEFVFRCPIFV